MGIFEKRNSDKIYAATKYNIYEITPYSIISIKNILVPVEQTKDEIPSHFSLLQNYPNPFNPTSIIQYEIPKSSLVTLKVYDLLGREVTTLVTEIKPAASII